MAEEEEEEQGFGKGQRKGGARHFSKPYVDSGLVFQVLEQNQDLLQDLKNYEVTSKCNSPDPKGLVQTLPLWKGLLRLEPSAEIHTQPLRTALITLLAQMPWLNTTSNSGQVWANLRMERISTILYHVRKVGREGLLSCAARLTRQEYENLQDGLKLLDGNTLGKVNALEKAKALEKADALEKAQAQSSETMQPVEGAKRKLKQHDSEVSMDSKGFPKMFGSPAPTDKETKPVAAMAMDRRRPGSKTAPLERGDLHQALGFGTRASKKPAAALGKASKKPAAALGKASMLLWKRHKHLILWKK